MTYEKTENFYVCKRSNTSKYRYILEDDLEYPKHFRKMHNTHPPALQKTVYNWSPAWPLLQKTLYISIEKEKKADTNLYNKKYAIHYPDLRLYLDFDMKLNKLNSF